MPTIKVKKGDELLYEVRSIGKIVTKDGWQSLFGFLTDFTYEFDTAHNLSEEQVDQYQIDLIDAFDKFQKYPPKNVRFLNMLLRNYNLVISYDNGKD